MTRARRSLLGIFPTVFAALAIALVASAQEPAPTAPAENQSEEPEAIPLPSLVAEAESAERFAREVGADLGLPRELERVDAELDELAPELEQRAERARALSAEAATAPDAFDAEAKDWRVQAEQLERWQEAATERLVDLGGSLDELAARRAVWQRTREAARAAQAPPEALARIDAVRAALRSAQSGARPAQRQLIELQARIADAQQIVADVQTRMDAARSRVERSLLEADSPPLWSAFSEPTSAWENATDRLASDAASARDYLRAQAGRFVLQGLALLGVAWLARQLRRAGRARSSGSDDPASAGVFTRPISAAALVALALTPIFHPGAPAIMVALARLALIAPVLRLLYALAPRELHGAIVVACALALLGELRGALAVAPAFERALFACELGLAAATLAWLMRPARLDLLRGVRRVPSWLPTMLRFVLGALGVALVANLLGWSSLAHRLGSGTLRAIYAALVVFGGTRVVRATLRAATASEAGQRLRLLREHDETVQRTTGRAVVFAGGALWAGLTLGGFGLWDDFGELARSAWERELTYGSLVITLGDILTFALTVWAAMLLARFTRFALEGDVLARFDTQRGVAHAVARTAQYAVLLLGFLAAAAAAGIDMNRFAVVVGALGVGIGFGLQNIVNNFVSGLILLYERPVQVGDSIEVDGVSGSVSRIGVRSSTVRTFEGADVILPNATLIAERLTNWTLSHRTRRVDVRVGIPSGADPRRALQLLLRCAREHPAVLADPEPIAMLVAFGERGLELELQFWVHLDQFLTARTEVTLAAHDALVAAGIGFAYPQRDLHLRSIAPEAARELRGASGEPNK